MTTLLCTDGSDLALEALRRGLAVVNPSEDFVVVTVVETSHDYDVVGGGFAGPTMSPSEADAADRQAIESGHQVIALAIEQLGLTGAQARVLTGPSAQAIVEFATALPADVVVIGTRGRSGLRQAILGSVSSHVVANAPCPVVVTAPGD